MWILLYVQTNMKYWLQCSLLRFWWYSHCMGTSSQAADRFESIMAKQETENTTVADGT